MPNRFPLIVNTTSGNSVQELPSGDFLDLSSSGISNSGNILVSGIVSATGNVTGGNILTAGAVSATGNVTGNYLLGNAALVTGLSASSISSGTSNVNVISSGGNVTVGVGGTANVSVFATTGQFVTGVMSSTGNGIHGNILTAGLISATGAITSSANITGGNILNNGLISSTGNSTAGNYLTAGLISATSTITSAANVVGGNITTGGLVSATSNIIAGNLRTAGLISATGSITTGGDLSLVGNIVDTGPISIITSSNGNIGLAPNGTGNVNITGNVMPTANATANIGSATLQFNTIFARATSAQYADLAEMYSAGSPYEPGTVVIFGGAYEVEISTTSHATTVAGVISTNPSYIMNAGQTGPHVAAVALQGRVPTRVIGNINKGDRMVTSHVPGVATVMDPKSYEPGCIIGKALGTYQAVFDDEGNEIPGLIEIVVGRV